MAVAALVGRLRARAAAGGSLSARLNRLLGDPVAAGGVNAAVVLALWCSFLARSWFATIWMYLPHGDVQVVDFAAFWASGKVVLAGHAPQAYDLYKVKAVLEQASGVAIPKGLPIYYPPPFLLAVAPLGLLPYGVAFAGWAALGLGGYVAAVRLATRRLAILVVAVAALGVFSSLMVGQNGTYTAALLAGGLALADRRPLAAGVLLGCLCYKPQLALLVPVALVFGGRWRTLAAAACTAAALLAAAWVLLGRDCYAAFFAASAHARHSFATTGWLPWGKVQTVYGALRQAHMDAGPAFAVCGVVALAVAVAVGWMWRAPARAPLRVAVVAAGAYLVTPYAFSYDAALLGISTAFLLADVTPGRPLNKAEIAGLMFAFMAPFVANPWPTTAPAAAVLVLLAVLRARRAEPGGRITEISPRASHPSATMEASY